jgi:hypothetical protein
VKNKISKKVWLSFDHTDSDDEEKFCAETPIKNVVNRKSSHRFFFFFLKM